MKANRTEQIKRAAVGGVTAWLAAWLRRRWGASARRAPRLAMVERIALAPRQMLALVEAEGRRFLVATSPEGAATFYPLDPTGRSASSRGASGRVSW